jgi:hypothetical protein
VGTECGHEDGHVLAALDASEAALGVEDPGSDPAAHHLAVAPPLDVPGGVAADGDHRLDGVGAGQAGREPLGDPQPPDGEHLVEPFAQAAGGVWPAVVEMGGQGEHVAAALDGIGVPERAGELAVDPRGDLFGQVVSDVAR